MVRVVIVDDHQLVRDGLRSLFQGELDLTLIGEARTGLEGVRLVEQLSPEVVVMDVTMPDLNGAEASRAILSAHPATGIVALSMHADRRSVARMLQAGCRGYVLKDCAYRELVDAVRHVAAGNAYLSPEVSRVVIDGLAKPGEPVVASEVEGLSAREREVMQLLAEGWSTKEIAGKLGVSAKTAETHRKNIKEKLGVNSIAEITKVAVREGMTTLERRPSSVPPGRGED